MFGKYILEISRMVIIIIARNNDGGNTSIKPYIHIIISEINTLGLRLDIINPIIKNKNP